MDTAGYLLFTALLVVGVVSLAAAVILMFRQAGYAPRSWSNRTTGALAVVALAWTVVVGAVLLFAPLMSSGSAGGAMRPDGSIITFSTTTTRSLLDSEGAGVIIVVLIPAGLILVAVLVRRRWAKPVRIGVGVVLLAGCILAALSVGAFYLPAAIVLSIAGLKTARPLRADRSRERARPGRARWE